ncbi:Uncharacterised protein [Orientia tsutsugamushi]|nr:Uncharacterised protein [Orientia tsutsugamushi]
MLKLKYSIERSVININRRAIDRMQEICRDNAVEVLRLKVVLICISFMRSEYRYYSTVIL